MEINQNIIRAIAASVVAIGGLGLHTGMSLVEYQTQCNKLQAFHDLLISEVDPHMSFADGEARRTKEQAALNAHRGIGISNSLHILGLARDKFLVIDGKVSLDAKDYLAAGVLWEQLGKNFGIPTAWGGRFGSVDAVHFSCSWKGVK